MKTKTSVEKIVNAILALKKRGVYPSYTTIGKKVKMSGEGVRYQVVTNRIKR